MMPRGRALFIALAVSTLFGWDEAGRASAAQLGHAVVDQPTPSSGHSGYALPDVDDDPSEAIESAARAQPSKSTSARPRKAVERPAAKQRRRAKSRPSRSTGSTSTNAKSSKAQPRTKSTASADRRCDSGVARHTHTVQSGEVIGVIAGTYGVSSSDIARWNPELKNIDFIRAGQALEICPEIPPRVRIERTVTVRSGQTLGGIAVANDLSVDELIAMQPQKLDNPNFLRVGQTLRIVTWGDVIADVEDDERALRELPEDIAADRASNRAKARGEPTAADRSSRRSRSQLSVPDKRGAQRRSARHARLSLRRGRLLPRSRHYRVKRPKYMWGTSNTVRTISRTIGRYRLRNGGPPILLGDISREGGGPLRGHRSHQTGLDLDVGLILRGKDRHAKDFVRATRGNLDVARTWALVDEFLRSGRVRYVFLDYWIQKQLYHHALRRGVSKSRLDEIFQYPRQKSRRYGIVRHWRGHGDHLHIRFRD